MEKIMTKHVERNPQKSELNELSQILSPYIKKIIKNALMITRVPESSETAFSYRKMSLWLDDVARFVTMTSTFSSVHLENKKHIDLKRDIQLTNHKIVLQLEALSKTMVVNESKIPLLIEDDILPLMTSWSNKLAPEMKKVIHELT